MLRYAITNRALYSGDAPQQQASLLHQASRWAADGIDLIQLREKDLPDATLADLAGGILQAIARTAGPTKLLINSRPDIAIATGAHGVHLTAAAGELTTTQVRELYAAANLPTPFITVSCHSLEEVRRARDNRADAILFAPVFEKTIGGRAAIRGQGLDKLRDACSAASPVPVYALGGVTHQNAASCLEAGAAGIAGIRLFRDC
jgi:thiamine-phosphate pyrophosphorylase